MPALHLAWTQSSSKKATLPEPAAVPQPIKTAVLVGEFRQPASSYAADLAALGYQVETIEDQKQELPAHVDLVVYATKSRKPSWADAAVKRGKLAWSVSDLQEKVHNLRIRKGG